VNTHLCVSGYTPVCEWIHTCTVKSSHSIHTCVWADVTSQLAQLHWCIAALGAAMWFLIRVSVAHVPNKLARSGERRVAFLTQHGLIIIYLKVYQDQPVTTTRLVLVHGWSGCMFSFHQTRILFRQTWDKVIPQLLKQNYCNLHCDSKKGGHQTHRSNLAIVQWFLKILSLTDSVINL